MDDGKREQLLARARALAQERIDRAVYAYRDVVRRKWLEVTAGDVKRICSTLQIKESRMTTSTRYESVKAAVDRTVERYASVDLLRAGIQAIPLIGGAVDTILSGRASRLQLARLDQFISQLHTRLSDVEGAKVNFDSDEFVDFMVTCLDKASRARTPEKSQRFADIVATQVSQARPWDEADMATRLLADLEDIHMSILKAALEAPTGLNAFAGVKVVALKSHAADTLLDGLSAPLLNELGSQYSMISLRLACSELTARGLLHDEGVGRWDAVAMTYFVATDLAIWLAEWIRPATANPA